MVPQQREPSNRAHKQALAAAIKSNLLNAVKPIPPAIPPPSTVSDVAAQAQRPNQDPNAPPPPSEGPRQEMRAEIEEEKHARNAPQPSEAHEEGGGGGEAYFPKNWKPRLKPELRKGKTAANAEEMKGEAEIGRVGEKGDAGRPGRSKNITPAETKKQNSAKFSRDENALGLGIKIDTSQLVKERTTDIDENYVIEKNIGEGGFGQVKLVRHKQLNEVRALKVVSKDNFSLEKQEEIRNEIRILRKMDHPNIVKLYEFHESEKYFNIIME